jgi:hypothetical protein
MIRVTRIIGESYNVETGETVSKLLVVTNGVDEVAIPIGDAYVESVIRLLTAEPITPQVPKNTVPAKPKRNGRKTAEPVKTADPVDLDDYDPGESYPQDSEGSSI